MTAPNEIWQLYLELYQKYGPPERLWPQWCASKKSPELRELIAIGAILTQRTSWHNADLALRNLKKAGLLSLQKISALPDLDYLAEIIRPAGFYQTKPKRLFNFCCFVTKEYGSLEDLRRETLEDARKKLLALKGIGPETADTILLYAFDKPTFVIDEYTRRLVRKRRLSRKLGYDHLKKLFERNLPRNAKIYQDFHALIIIKEKGRARSVMKEI